MLKFLQNRLTWENCPAWCLCEWSSCCECILFWRWADLREAKLFSGWIFWSKSWRGPPGSDRAVPWPWRWSHPRSRTTWSEESRRHLASSGRTWTQCEVEGVSSWCIPVWWQLWAKKAISRLESHSKDAPSNKIIHRVFSFKIILCRNHSLAIFTYLKGTLKEIGLIRLEPNNHYLKSHNGEILTSNCSKTLNEFNKQLDKGEWSRSWSHPRCEFETREG